MNQMEAAFEKAGVPSAAVSFASACHDLARLALNRAADPERAVHVWLGMASGPDFRLALKAYLASVAREREQKSAGERGHPSIGTHVKDAPLPAEANSDGEMGHNHGAAQTKAAPSSSGTHPAGEAGHSKWGTHSGSAPSPAGTASDDGSGQARSVTQTSSAAPSSETDRGGGGQRKPDTQADAAVSPAPRSPTQQQISGVTAAKVASARIMSGVFVTERQGSKTALDDITTASLDRRLKWHGQQAAGRAVEYNTLWLVRAHIEKQAYVPDGAIVGDVLDAGEIRKMHDMARAFAASPMVTLPESLRQEIAA